MPPFMSDSQHHSTTPSLGDAARTNRETDARGNAHVNATIRHRRRLALSATPSTNGELAEGACDAIRIDTDDTCIYGQPPERARIVVDGNFPDGTTNWTLGAGTDWTVSGDKATHATGNTGALSQDTGTTNADDPILDEDHYVLVFTVSGRTAGSVTAAVGATTTLTTHSADGTYVEYLEADGDTITFTPTSDFDGAVSDVWLFPLNGPYAAGQIPEAFSHIVGAAASSDKTTLIASARVEAQWYRRAGATEIS